MSTIEPILFIPIVLVAIVQSVFGVGVLLFGTPILIVMGYDYPTVLATLLPISIGISLSQIVRDWRSVDLGFIRGVLLYTVPCIVVFLLVALHARQTFGLLIAGLLLLFALRNQWAGLRDLLDRTARFERVWLVCIGVMHGLTNLGGSLLSMRVQQLNYGKDAARATIATSYIMFASFQLATLMLTRPEARGMLGNSLVYAVAGVAVYFVANELIFKKISNQGYARAFTGFLFCSGVLVALKSI